MVSYSYSFIIEAKRGILDIHFADIVTHVHEQGFFVPDKGHTDQNPVNE